MEKAHSCPHSSPLGSRMVCTYRAGKVNATRNTRTASACPQFLAVLTFSPHMSHISYCQAPASQSLAALFSTCWYEKLPGLDDEEDIMFDVLGFSSSGTSARTCCLYTTQCACTFEDITSSRLYRNRCAPSETVSNYEMQRVSSQSRYPRHV